VSDGSPTRRDSSLCPYTTLFRSAGSRILVAITAGGMLIGEAAVGNQDDRAVRPAIRLVDDLRTVQQHPAFGAEWLWQMQDLLVRSEEHTSELQSREDLVCRLLLE